MHRDTRILFNAYVGQIANLNGVSAQEVTATKFAVAPNVEQKLEEVIKQSSVSGVSTNGTDLRL